MLLILFRFSLILRFCWRICHWRFVFVRKLFTHVYRWIVYLHLLLQQFPSLSFNDIVTRILTWSMQHCLKWKKSCLSFFLFIAKFPFRVWYFQVSHLNSYCWCCLGWTHREALPQVWKNLYWTSYISKTFLGRGCFVSTKQNAQLISKTHPLLVHSFEKKNLILYKQEKQ